MPSRNRGAQDPRWQRWFPQPKPICSIGTGSVTTQVIPFSVPNPDSRLRVRVSLHFVTNKEGSGVPPTLLWLYEADDNDYGLSPAEIPLVNLVGSAAAPVAIPLGGDLNLLGWSREFVTAGDYIKGQITCSGNGGSVGVWVLSCKYQPNAVRLTDDEWDLITAQCNPTTTFVNLP